MKTQDILANKYKWLTLCPTKNGNAMVMFENGRVRIIVPGDETGPDLAEEEVIEAVKHKFGAAIKIQEEWGKGIPSLSLSPILDMPK